MVLIRRFAFLFFLFFCTQAAWSADVFETKDLISERMFDGLNNFLRFPDDRPEFTTILAQEMLRYERSTTGITKPNYWLLYLWTKELSQKRQTTLSAENLQKLVEIGVPHFGIMRLAQDYTTQTAKEPGVTLKVATLFRNGGDELISFLRESSTLYVPLVRAFVHFNKEKANPKPFVSHFLDELLAGYWHDNEFVDALLYFRDYFAYEFYLAQLDPKNSEYDLLLNANVDDLALRQTANFLALRVIAPALMDILVSEGVELTEASKQSRLLTTLSALQTVFHSKDLKSATGLDHEGATVWYQITEQILSTRHNFKEKTHSRRFGRLGSFSKSNLRDAENTADVIESLAHNIRKERSFDKQKIDQISRALANFRCDDKYKFAYNKFVDLQTSIRAALEVNHFGEHVAQFAAGSWEKKIAILFYLSQIFGRDDSVAYPVIGRLAMLLVHSAHYLPTAQLNQLLFILATLDKPVEFHYVDSVLTDIAQTSSKRNTPICSSSSSSSYVAPSDSTVLSQEMRTRISAYRHSLQNKKLKELEIAERSNPYVRLPVNKGDKDKEKKKIKISIVMPRRSGIGELMYALSGTSLFSHIGHLDLHLVARMAKPIALLKGQTLYYKGDRSDSLAVIMEGALDIVDEGRVIASLGKGQVVGEMSLFNKDATRNATVVGKEDTTLYEISKSQFVELLSYKPALLQTIFNQLLAKVEASYKRLEMMGMPIPETSVFDKSLTTVQKLEWGFCCDRLSPRAGSPLAIAGKPAASLFFAMTPGFVLRSEKETFSCPKGTFVGELDFLKEDGVNRYSLTTQNDACEGLAMSRERFANFTEKDSEVLWNMSRTLVEIIADNNLKLRNTDNYKLQRACETDDVESVRGLAKMFDLLNAPCVVLSTMSEGTRPIHVAAKYGSKKMLTFLVNNHANIDAQDALGNTAAHIAVMEGQDEFLQSLYKYQANLKMFNLAKRTPYKMALDFERERAIEFLKEVQLDETDSISVETDYDTEKE